MKIICISDLHGQLININPCDLLLIAGDITPVWDHGLNYQQAWLDKEFRSWLKNIPAERVVGVWGNHDKLAEESPHRVPKDLRWEVLNCESTQAFGLNIWGSPYQPWFYDWAFNAPKKDGEKFLEKKYADIPEDTNIVISHDPSSGGLHFNHHHIHKLDYTTEGIHAGSRALAARLVRLSNLKLFVTGHIHEGYGHIGWPAGTYPDGRKYSNKYYVNASLLDEDYQAGRKPISFNYDGTNLELIRD